MAKVKLTATIVIETDVDDADWPEAKALLEASHAAGIEDCKDWFDETLSFEGYELEALKWEEVKETQAA